MSVTEFDPNSVEWAEPPSRSSSGAVANYAPFVETLRQHPGEWAILRHDATTGKVQDLRNVKGVEVTSRPNGDGSGTSTVWAKWVGVDEYGETVLSPEAKARKEARAARKAAKEAAEGAAASEATDPFA